MVVPARSFTPPPKVDSQLLILKRRAKPLFDVDAKRFFQIVHAGFANRRKTLLNSLAAGLHKDKSEVGMLLQEAGLDPANRPQELSLEQWYAVYQLL